MKRASRARSIYWQRLRKDRASALAVSAILIAVLCASIAWLAIILPATGGGRRSNPFYWVLMLPVGWWCASLAYYEAWAVRLLKPAMIVFPAATAIALVVAAKQSGDVGLSCWALGLSVIGAVTCAVSLRESLLAQEGPFR